MRARAVKALERAYRPVLNYLAPGAIVLGYHRVSNAAWDPLRLSISIENFRSHLDIILQDYDPISLASLVAKKQRGMKLKGFVVITFDDGCEQFVRYAMPELADRNIPSTVFVTTGYTGIPFWWDQVSQLLSPGNTGVDKSEICFEEMESTGLFKKLQRSESAAEAVRETCRQLLTVEPSERSKIIDQIGTRIGEHSKAKSVPRAMTHTHLRELSKNSLVEIGAHSVTHPMLAELTKSEQVREIQQSKSDLEALGSHVVGFSYPNGSFSQQTCDLVEECGFQYACTSQQAAVRAASDNYQVPRIWAPDLGSDEFRRWISAWSGRRL